jgi:hypothetical protein
LIGTVLAAPLFALNSATTLEQRGLILALNHPLDSEAEQLFKGVVTQSVRWGLQRQKLGVVESTASFSEQSLVPDPAEHLDSSTAEQVDFILITEYASRGNELEIRMAWYDPQSGEKTQEVIRRGRKDLVLDKIIREALSELLSSVQSSLDTLQPRELAPQTQAGNTSTVNFNAGGADGSGSANLRTQPLPQIENGKLPAPGTPNLPQEGIAGESVQDRVRHFDIGVGCAPFVATGVSSEYFKLGIMPVLNLSYLIQGKVSRIGLGMYGGMNVFTASGDLTTAETYLIPVGFSFRYEIGSQRYPSAVFGIAAGPALMMMNTSGDDPLFGLTFFGRGTLGVRLPIGRTFALLVEAGYDVYWEQPQPIMGFSPAVSTTIRI